MTLYGGILINKEVYGVIKTYFIVSWLNIGYEPVALIEYYK